MREVSGIPKKLLLAFGTGFLGGVIVSFFFLAKPVKAQAPMKYNYLHFRAGSCRQGNVEGQGVIDLRNGNAWCVPSGSQAPAFEGTLNLSGIPEHAPSNH